MGLLAAFCIITAPKPIQSVSFEISPSPQYPHRVSRHISSIPRSCFPSLKHLACIIAVCSYCTACSRVERTGSETYVAWKVPVLPAQIRTTTQWGKYQDIKGQWKIGFSASEGDADPYMIMKPLFFFDQIAPVHQETAELRLTGRHEGEAGLYSDPFSSERLVV